VGRAAPDHLRDQVDVLVFRMYLDTKKMF
jgi:hypothetical protein